MSFGLMCLKCRKYIGNKEWHCTCEIKKPSMDGKTLQSEPKKQWMPIVQHVPGQWRIINPQNPIRKWFPAHRIVTWPNGERTFLPP